VPEGLYRMRFCIAVACQTFSSDVLIPAVASVERRPKERRHRPAMERMSRCGNSKTVRISAGALRANPK
jgi:hypothetical protein